MDRIKRNLTLVGLMSMTLMLSGQQEGNILDDDDESIVFGSLDIDTIAPDDTLWRSHADFGLNFNQVSLSNWAGGGQSSVSIGGLFGGRLEFKKRKVLWLSTLDLGYGVISQNYAGFQKSDDQLELNSKLGFMTRTPGLYLTSFLNLKTQMAPGYDYPNDSIRISNFLAPGYLLLGQGFDYHPNDDFNVMLAPVTGKLTIVTEPMLADAGAFGVDPAEYDEVTGQKIRDGERVRYEFGGYLKLAWKVQIMENITYSTKLDLFSNYLNNPLNIDVNWENKLKMTVNRYINVSITTHLIYDDDVVIGVDTDGDDTADRFGPRTQFKEVLAIGFTYGL